MALVSELVTELKVKDVGFASGMKAAVGAVTAFAAAGVALYAAVGSITERIDEMTKSASKLGVSRGSFEALSYAADIANVSMDTVSVALKKLAVNLNSANSGNKDMEATFKRLGLSAKDLQGMSLDKAYEKIGTAINSVSNSAERVAIAQKIFGRSGIDNLNLFKDGIAGLTAEYDKLGLTISDSQAAAADSFHDSKTRLTAIFSGFAAQVGADVAPAFTILMDGLSQSLTGTNSLRDAARLMAGGIVSAIRFAVDGFDILLTVLDQVIDKMNQIQPLQRLEMARQFAINAVSGAGFSTNPNMIGSLSAQANPSQMGGSMSGIQSGLSGLEARLGEKTYTSLIVPINRAGDAVNEFATSVKKSKSEIGGILDSFNKGQISTELQRILKGSIEDGRPVYQNDQLDSKIQEIYKMVGQSDSNQVQAELSMLSADVQRIASGGQSSEYNIKPLIGVVEQLRQYAAEQTGKKMSLEITVSTNDKFNLQIAKSKEVKATISEQAQAIMANEAAGIK